MKLNFKGAVFDLDGVVTKTAHIHSKAWKTMFDEFLKKWSARKNIPFVPFTHEKDYIPYVDGKPRYKGVQSFLESRGINIPFGDKSDGPDKETVCGLGNRKNLLYNEIVAKDGAFVFHSTIKLIKEMKKNNIRIGVASSSKNTLLILQTSKIEDLFETRVDGVVSEEMGLKGKPDPDIFITAAKNLGLLPGDCMMIEDAISGVQAGKNGDFGLVLGVARQGDDEALYANGADIVVKDLGDISLKDINVWFEKGIEKDSWILKYYGFDPAQEKLRETLCTVGNGYFGTRGCFEGEKISDTFYPGTYIAGIYNKIPTLIEGKKIFNNDLVNCPNWLSIEFKIGSGNFVSPFTMEILSYEQKLNLKTAEMERTIRCRNKSGKITKIKSVRIASMADPHIGAIKFSIIPENYSEKITIKSGLNGKVKNYGVARYRELNSHHISVLSTGSADSGIFLNAETTASKYQIMMAAKNYLFLDKSSLKIKPIIKKEKTAVFEEFSLNAVKGKAYTIEKIVSIYTSKDKGIKDIKASALMSLKKSGPFSSVFRRHSRAWNGIWRRADIKISGDRFVQKVTRLHIYHLLCTASYNSLNIDAGLPARGLHGEAYRGHIFWDSIYILPFFNLHFPEITKAMLMYRYHRLDDARKYAQENSYEGAMYPWQTADTGTEETQIIHYNPVSGKWDPDLSRLQRHVSITVFYNIWDYYQKTEDYNFIVQYGAETALEIARFWASATDFDQNDGRYHIHGVMGPDEYHEKYPGAKKGGLNDNAYTNIMVVWLMEQSLRMIEKLPQAALKSLSERTGFKVSETEKWKDITRKMYIPFINDYVIEQYEGYDKLKELDWDYYRNKYKNIGRMDRILKSEGDSPDKYKVSKQADLLMTFYIIPPEEIKEMLNKLGYKIKSAKKLVEENYEYYQRHTSHGSTLSRVVHAAIARNINRNDVAWRWFIEAMKSDIYDTQGGTTVEGIHCGVMAGTLMFIINNLAGITCYNDILNIQPNLPTHLNKLNLRLSCHMGSFQIEISKKSITVLMKKKPGKKLSIRIAGREIKMVPGRKKTIQY